ncbi:helix-turn-helix domain-containing protein [Rhodococcus sp. NPDC056743]|uniref:helix-turn-helix domain-containing protein n=1 Tax=unclassified Rhodococcus (in: high G+C Gram-positive bacteria) TaxID=192944 RepID=UPI00110E9D2D|nr:XRE family transcriptional regulator [Rhodococcus sp. KBS0724]TSD48830.1 helix-turn-helix transcriptional regulator [Rhodococcus sp. KBS0724]
MSSSPESASEQSSTAGASVRDAVATNLRRARMARGYSLRDLAELTGISKALLSQMERRVANPTVEILVRAGAAVDLSFAELTRAALLAPEVIRAQDGPSMVSGDVTIRTLFGTSDRRRFEMSEGIVPEHTSSSKSSHGLGSIEYTYVVSGHLRVASQDWSYELGPGDSVRFSCEHEHSYSTDHRSARILTLISFSDD